MKGGGFADDKDYIVVGGRNSGKLYAYYQNPNAWQPNQPKQIVTSSLSSNNPNTDQLYDASHRITQYVADLQNTIHELEVRLDDAQEEIADYIEMIDEKNEKIEGQAKFIEILQRQIAIAEKYIINENGRNTRVD
jgi:chromosome segregation ATPase